MGPNAPGETRAEIARRRLAELAAAFDAPPPADSTLSREDDPEDEPASGNLVERMRRLSFAHLRAVATVAAVVLVIAAWWLIQSRPSEKPVGELVAAQTLKSSADTKNEEPAELVVDVAGKVRRPGIVVLPTGSRVHDAIEAAGGTSGKVDLSDLNLARVLVDGEQVRVGLDDASVLEGANAKPGATGPSNGGLVNINAADAAELETLPGVGPVTAGAIIDWRARNGSFRSVDDLIDVRGIGEATLERLRDLVRV